jgi:hypothetical protein
MPADRVSRGHSGLRKHKKYGRRSSVLCVGTGITGPTTFEKEKDEEGKERYRFHPVVCIQSCGYDRQHDNKAVSSIFR